MQVLLFMQPQMGSSCSVRQLLYRQHRQLE
jgi:hypothetical protein